MTQLEGVASRLVFGLGGTGNPASLENRTSVVRLLPGIGYNDIMLYGFFPVGGVTPWYPVGWGYGDVGTAAVTGIIPITATALALAVALAILYSESEPRRFPLQTAQRYQLRLRR